MTQQENSWLNFSSYLKTNFVSNPLAQSVTLIENLINSKYPSNSCYAEIFKLADTKRGDLSPAFIDKLKEFQEQVESQQQEEELKEVPIDAAVQSINTQPTNTQLKLQ